MKHVAAVATVAFFIALALPAVALASGGKKCNASACKVYIEPDVPTAAGGHTAQSPHPTSTSTNQPQSTPTNLSRVLAHAGPDKDALSRLLRDSGIGTLQSPTVAVVAPSALGAAFDLGTGPTVLLALLLATAVGLAVLNGLRGWRGRGSGV